MQATMLKIHQLIGFIIVGLSVGAILSFGSEASNALDQYDSSEPSIGLAIVDNPETTIHVLENLLRNIGTPMSIDLKSLAR